MGGRLTIMTTSKINSIAKILISLLLSFICWGATTSAAAIPSDKTLVMYFGQASATDFEVKVKPIFAQNASACKTCELINMTPYKEDGSVDISALVDKVKSVPAGTSFIFFDFNAKVSEQNKKLVDILNEKAMAGLVVVAAAGSPKDQEPSSSLSKTVFGQVRDAVIIGELTERDRLLPASGFYGPEMLTAIRPPRDLIGQGYSPLIFASNLAENWSKRKPNDWIEHFRAKKSKNRKLWMSLNDLF